MLALVAFETALMDVTHVREERGVETVEKILLRAVVVDIPTHILVIAYDDWMANILLIVGHIALHV
jgi:hypothetical protein